MSDDEEEKAGGGWIVSFADLMTLLFAAFVVLYGITPQGESDEVKGAIASIRSSFVEIPDDIIDKTLSNHLDQGKMNFDKAINTGIRDDSIKKFNRNESLPPDVNQKLNELDIKLDKIAQGQGIQSSLVSGDRAERDELRPPFRPLAACYFGQNQIILNQNYHNKMKELGLEIKKTGRKILLEGHTNLLSQHSRFTQLEVATKRVLHVKEILVKEVGIDAKRINIAAYGSLKPIRLGIGPASDPISNDRVEIKIEQ